MTTPPRFLTSQLLSGFPEIRHGFNTRHGDLNSESFPFLSRNIATLEQVHGAEVAILKSCDNAFPKTFSVGHGNAQIIGKYDAVVTNQSHLAIAVKTADCTPILIFDRKQKVLAAVHAGWRSAAAGILPKTLELMKTHFGSSGNDLVAALGPAIDVENFEVGELVRSAYLSANRWFKAKASGSSEPKYFFNLKAALREELLHFGIPETSVEVLPHCTVRDAELFSSYRREKDASTRQWNVLQMI